MVKQPLCWYLCYSSVMLCLCVGRMVCISLFKLLWTGSGRLLGFLWKRNTTVSCLEVYWINFKHQIYSTLRSTFSVLQAHWSNNAPCPPPYRSDWLTVFSATVPGITCNRGSVRLIWSATPAYAHHSEENFLKTFSSFVYHYSFCKKTQSPFSRADSFTSNWVPCVSVRADVLLCSLGCFPELQHVPFVSGNWGHL